MTDQPFSLHTPFEAFFITRTEIKKSVIYGGGRQVFVEQEGQNQPEIELNDATVPVL